MGDTIKNAKLTNPNLNGKISLDGEDITEKLRAVLHAPPVQPSQQRVDTKPLQEKLDVTLLELEAVKRMSNEYAKKLKDQEEKMKRQKDDIMLEVNKVLEIKFGAFSTARTEKDTGK